MLFQKSVFKTQKVISIAASLKPQLKPLFLLVQCAITMVDIGRYTKEQSERSLPDEYAKDCAA